MSFDADYKRLFSHPELVRDLLAQFVPGPWRSGVCWETLDRVPESFVAENDRQRCDDLIWRVRTQGGWLWIYVILEFQSEPDEWMALRVMVYVGLLAQRLVQEKQLIDGKLPPIVPVVLYRGSRPWNAAQNVAECFLQPPAGLEGFVPQLHYHLIDEARLQVHEEEALRNLAAAFFRLEQTRSLDDLKRFYVVLDGALRSPTLTPVRRTLARWLVKRLRRSDGVQTLDELEMALMEDATMLDEVIEREFSRAEARGRQEGKLEGRIEGKLEGRIEGKLEGEALILLRLMRRRFGVPVPDWVETRLSQADEAQILAWGDRLLEVDRLEEMFGD